MTCLANWSHFTFITKNLQQLNICRILNRLPWNDLFFSHSRMAILHIKYTTPFPTSCWGACPLPPGRERQQPHRAWLSNSTGTASLSSPIITDHFHHNGGAEPAPIMQGKSCMVPLIPAFPRLELSRGSGLCSNVSLSENLPSSPKLNTHHFPGFHSSAALRVGHGGLPWHHLGMGQRQILDPTPDSRNLLQPLWRWTPLCAEASSHPHWTPDCEIPRILPAAC